MDLYILPHGILDTNTYIVSDDDDCAVIDCGTKAAEIIKVIEANNLKLKYIILTHGHFDHVLYASDLKEATGAPICLHQADKDIYLSPDKNGLNFFGVNREYRFLPPDVLLKDGQILKVGKSELEIIHTPGHSPGSVCIKAQNSLFSGDTLFAMSVGRTDLYGGSAKALNESIINKLFVLNDDVLVYPGHGGKSAIGFEKVNNPYV